MGFHQAKAYIKHQLQAGTEHGLDSEFVHELYSKVIQPEKNYYVFLELEELRKKLLKDERTISITDFGAGSKVMKGNERRISQIAHYSVGGRLEGKLLFKLIDFLKPNTMLELGTSLGLNTLYQHLANPNAELITFEGCPNTARIAQENFKGWKVKPRVVMGNIDETLRREVAKLEKLDYVFFDANHRYQPTIDYFNVCLEKSHENTIFIFDDIHWSAEMEQAWEEIKQHESVSITVDLFELGLVFFKKEQPKQHFRLKL
ncbi:MAG: putative O-methyltransferase YrrM [Arenicella sp.]|jgi:predicted O-methyltransferase YrrM